MIDTHCHLDYLKQVSTQEVIDRSKVEGVKKFITISVAPENLDTVLGIAHQFEDVYCTQGIHPHDAKKYSDDVGKKIKKNVSQSEDVIAIGEIGLDYYYDNSPREIQKEVFQKQLTLASNLNLPVVIHTREAEVDTQKILEKNLNSLTRRGVLHSFSSQLDLAKFAINNDFYLGFNGMVTFKKADLVREAVKLCPIEQILIETDSPFLCPTPHRGKENAPFYLKYIAEKIAEIKKLRIEDVIKITNNNAVKLFDLKVF